MIPVWENNGQCSIPNKFPLWAMKVQIRWNFSLIERRLTPPSVLIVLYLAPALELPINKEQAHASTGHIHQLLTTGQCRGHLHLMPGRCISAKESSVSNDILNSYLICSQSRGTNHVCSSGAWKLELEVDDHWLHKFHPLHLQKGCSRQKRSCTAGLKISSPKPRSKWVFWKLGFLLRCDIVDEAVSLQVVWWVWSWAASQDIESRSMIHRSQNFHIGNAKSAAHSRASSSPRTCANCRMGCKRNQGTSWRSTAAKYDGSAAELVVHEREAFPHCMERQGLQFIAWTQEGRRMESRHIGTSHAHI